MTISVSHALTNAVLDTASFKTAFDLVFLKLYAGTIPTNTDPALPDAEAALGGATLLRTYTVSDDGTTGLGWAASASSGIITKDTGETWSGTAVATGTAAFWRMVLTGDDDSASTAYKRIQGNCGTAGADLILPTVSVVNGVSHTIDNFSFYGLTPS